MSYLHEFCVEPWPASYYVAAYGNRWRAQTFTPSIAHNIVSCQFSMARVGSPGTVTIALKATGVGGIPTGEDLTTGTVDGNGFSTSYEWREILLTPYALSANTKYVLIIKALNGDADNCIRIDIVNGVGTQYTRGEYYYTIDSGVYWYTQEWDLLFKEYGDVPAGQGYIWGETTKIHWIDENGVEQSNQGALVAAGSNPEGTLWFESDYLHYIDELGDERRILGVATGVTGQPKGTLWVEGANVHGIDDDGDEVYIAGA